MAKNKEIKMDEAEKKRRADEKARKKLEKVQAEEADAQRISKLPRRSKEKAKQDKVWLSDQSSRARTITSDAKNSDEEACQTEKRRKKKGKANTLKLGKASKEPESASAKQMEPKQKQSERPVLDLSLLNQDHPSSKAAEPLPAKEVVVKPGRLVKPTVTVLPVSKHACLPEPDSDEDSSKSSGSDEDSSSSESDDKLKKPRLESSDDESDEYKNSGESSSEDDDEDDEGEDDEMVDDPVFVDENAGGLVIQDGNEIDEDTDAGLHEIPEDKHTEISNEVDYLDSTKATGSRKRAISAGKSTGTAKAKKQKCLEERPRMKTLLPESTKRSKKQGKNLAMTNQVPLLRADTKRELLGQPNILPAVLVGDARAQYELTQHKDTHLIYKAKGGIGVTQQSPEIRRVASAIIKKFHFVLAFKYGFIPANERFVLQREFAIAAVTELEPKVSKHIIRRLKKDVSYLKQFVDVAELRDIQFRTGMKAAAAARITKGYDLPVMVATMQPGNLPADPEAMPLLVPTSAPSAAAVSEPQDDPKDQHSPGLSPQKVLDVVATLERVQKLLVGLAYAHPGAIETRGPVDSDRSFDHDAVSDLIRDQFFVRDGRGSPSLATTYWSEFKSSEYYYQHEKEIPEAMLGLACASIRLALADWSTGTYTGATKYNTTLAEGEYKLCMDVLAELREKQPGCYHRALHNVYLKATGGQQAVVTHQASVKAALAGLAFK